MKTLKASLLASVIVTVAWLLGFMHKIWPSHPHLAVVFLTVALTWVFIYVWPERQQ